ncbi:unnamed protein product [Ascophyllum nodosum]
MTGKLEGKVALVTGASSGIGKATALLFSKEGAKVVLNARSEDKLRSVADEIKASGGDVAIAVGDVSKEEDCKKMVEVAVETFGGLHVAFNNAGIVMTAPFSEITEDMASKVFDINLKSLVFCFKYQIPAMAKSGNKGSIIVDGSVVASRTSALPFNAGVGVYAASKAGANMLMKYAAIEGGPSGVRVNSISPGHVETPIYGSMTHDQLTEIAKMDQVIGRPIEPEEIAKLVLFLASDDAAMVTGSVYTMDGGWSIKA